MRGNDSAITEDLLPWFCCAAREGGGGVVVVVGINVKGKENG